MITVKYFPCIFEDRCYEFESANQTVLAIFLSLFQKYPEVREDSNNTIVRVNGKILDPLFWKNSLKDGDRVFIIQEIGYGIGEAIWGAIIWLGSALTYEIPYIGMQVWQAALLVCSLAYTIYSYCTAPSAPDTGKGLNTGPTYGWDGATMQSRQGIPVPVVYGEHLLGGNIIGGGKS